MANYKIPPSFFQRPDTHQIAKELLGKVLIRVENGKTKAGLIVETEAYDGFDDRASHAAKARTPRTEVMFGPGGHYYVYFIYGMYWNLNIVTGYAEVPSAVLIRALEPLFDDELDLDRYSLKEKFKLASGPGKLCRWLNIDKEFYGKSVENDELFLVNLDDFLNIVNVDISKIINKEFEIIEAKRIGVDYAGDSANLHWRYYIKDNQFVSVKKIPST